MPLLQRQISSLHFSELMADYALEPYEQEVISLNLARLLAITINANRKKGSKRVSEYDFLPETYKPEANDDPGTLYQHIKAGLMAAGTKAQAAQAQQTGKASIKR